MATKKFYGVKKGKKTGIFSSWDECRESVTGYPGAEYKGFATLAEVQSYLGVPNGHSDDGSVSDDAIIEEIQSGVMLAYVDGSYDDTLKKYAFGCVLLLEDGRIYTEYGNGDNPQSLQHRNVTGEMLGAMYAVKCAMMNGFSTIEIRYDYEGIEKWVTGEWRSKTELTGKYAAAMREWSRQIGITFTKVAAHSNVKYNELADQLAKRGLREGEGIPKVRRLEEMTLYTEK